MFFLADTTTAYAWEAHLNENGDIEIYTSDKKKTSNIWYRSIGLTITRCQYDPTTKEIHEEKNYIRCFFDGEAFIGSTTESHGQQFNTFCIPMSTVIARAGGEWAKEIQDAIDGVGPAVYLKLDCMMVTYQGTKIDLDGPYTNYPGDGHAEGVCDVGKNSSGIRIDDRYPWANKSGLKTHFNHYLLIGNGVIAEPTDAGDDFLVMHDYTVDHLKHGTLASIKDAGELGIEIDENVPTFVTGNTAEPYGYNLSQGIPTTESLRNRTTVDTWFGDTKVYARTVSKEYEWEITYFWLEDFGHEDIHGVYVEDWDYVAETHEIPIGFANVAFEYLADVHMYDLTNAGAHNGAYPGAIIGYDDEEEIPMICISTEEYKDIGTNVGDVMTPEEPNWVADSEKHVEMPETISYLHAREIGSRDELASAIIEDRDIIRDMISSRCHTKNDHLTVDNMLFMNDEDVTGCNFFDYALESAEYEACDKSSAVVCEYPAEELLQDTEIRDSDFTEGKETDVEVPSGVDNGLYHTWLEVMFQRLIPYFKTGKRLATINAPY